MPLLQIAQDLHRVEQLVRTVRHISVRVLWLKCNRTQYLSICSYREHYPGHQPPSTSSSRKRRYVLNFTFIFCANTACSTAARRSPPCLRTRPCPSCPTTRRTAPAPPAPAAGIQVPFQSGMDIVQLQASDIRTQSRRQQTRVPYTDRQTQMCIRMVLLSLRPICLIACAPTISHQIIRPIIIRWPPGSRRRLAELTARDMRLAAGKKGH